MKPLTTKLTSAVVFFLFFSAAQIASAFYEPSLGRWLNRDPFGDLGFQETTLATGPRHRESNLHAFVDNAPGENIDAWALSQHSEVADRIRLIVSKKH